MFYFAIDHNESNKFQVFRWPQYIEREDLNKLLENVFKKTNHTCENFNKNYISKVELFIKEIEKKEKDIKKRLLFTLYVCLCLITVAFFVEKSYNSYYKPFYIICLTSLLFMLMKINVAQYSRYIIEFTFFNAISLCAVYIYIQVQKLHITEIDFYACLNIEVFRAYYISTIALLIITLFIRSTQLPSYVGLFLILQILNIIIKDSKEPFMVYVFSEMFLFFALFCLCFLLILFFHNNYNLYGDYNKFLKENAAKYS